MSDMDQYKDIFLSESAEFLQGITDGLLALESNPTDLEPVEVVFRGAHSLKGMSAAMGYDLTADLTHKMESLMDRVRKRERVADPPLVDLMLDATDLLRALIDAESSGGSNPDTTATISRLVAMAEEEGNAAISDADAGGQADDRSNAAVLDDRADATVFRVKVTLEDACVLKSVRAYMVIKRLSHMGTVVDTVPPARELEDEQFDRDFEIIVSTPADATTIEKAVMAVSEVHAVTSELVDETDEDLPGEEPAEEGAPRRPAIPKLSETQTVRIAIGHLDTMVNLVGELVIIRSRLERVASDLDSRDLEDTIEVLHRVAGELQHEVMHTRMVPVGNIFNRFPRAVRDLARDLGRSVDFSMSGLDIELDRTVLDEIGDPILHLLRNSVDHGIEPAEDRMAAGKDPKGTVHLDASRERDQVRISVSDDGRGMDVARVWGKACDLGLAHAESRDSYSDDDILLFTCVPGFSTAAQATRVSGRGVGMDVVKGKIEHLGGTLQINTAPGQGTEFVLTLPLTLAIIQALLVGARGQVFAMPLSAVDEVMSPDEVQLDTVDSAPVVVLRDGTIAPVYPLDALLGVGGQMLRDPQEGEHIVLTDTGGQKRALLVEEMLGRREIVIKPLSRMFRNVRGLGGATVLGDGNVALILDPRTMFPSREEVL